MGKVLQLGNKAIPEGEILNKYFQNRLMERNQNVILAVTGSTGSGKSYGCMRIAELWYQRRFKTSFPVENVCFSITELMKLLNSGNMRKGELLIMEEGGVLLNSLDFQNKVSKLFSFVLQSFRSMNVALIINLPVLTMLNKSCRLLLHGHFITSGIDYETKTLKFKPLFHQLNQSSGTSFWKYIRINHGGYWKKIHRFNYKIPPKELLTAYEIKKASFVSNLTDTFVKELEAQEAKERGKLERKPLTERQLEIFNLLHEGLNQTEITKKLGITSPAISQHVKAIEKKGYKTTKEEVSGI